MLFCPVLVHTEPRSAAMPPRRPLDSFTSAGSRPFWSNLHTGTLPRLISLICHSYENTRGVGLFFPFWYTPSGTGDGNSLLYSSSFFSHSSGLLCTTADAYLLLFQSIPHSFHVDGGCIPPGEPSARHSSLAASFKFSLFNLFRTVLHSFAFFCTPAKLNPFIFCR